MANANEKQKHYHMNSWLALINNIKACEKLTISYGYTEHLQGISLRVLHP